MGASTNGVLLSLTERVLKMKSQTVVLNVTQKDIDRAIEWKRKRNALNLLSYNCPIARAGRHTFRNVSQAYSGRLAVYKNRGKSNQKTREFQLDAVGCSVVYNFDCGRYNLLKPCVVTLTSVKR